MNAILSEQRYPWLRATALLFWNLNKSDRAAVAMDFERKIRRLERMPAIALAKHSVVGVVFHSLNHAPISGWHLSKFTFFK